MTRPELIRRIKGLSNDRFKNVAPFIEADIEAADKLVSLYKEIQAARRSAATQPILVADSVYSRVRQALAR